MFINWINVKIICFFHWCLPWK